MFTEIESIIEGTTPQSYYKELEYSDWSKIVKEAGEETLGKKESASRPARQEDNKDKIKDIVQKKERRVQQWQQGGI